MVAYAFKRQFVAPICKGLGRDVPRDFYNDIETDNRPKLQTIRAGFIRRGNGEAFSKPTGGRRHARLGEDLQLYFWLRTKSCFLIGRAKCIEVQPIVLWFVAGTVVATVGGKPYGPRKMRDLAVADGFKDPLAMAAFWSHENGTREGDRWSGVLIRWSPC